MTKLEIVDSLPKHVKELCLSLREGEKEEALGLGLNPNQAAYYTNRYAVYRQTALVDGEVAAIWGLHGILLGTTGKPYLLTNEKISKVSPLVFARVYKQEVEIMKNMFPVLENYVDAEYPQAVRMLKIAGFDIVKEIKLPNKKIYYKFRITQ